MVGEVVHGPQPLRRCLFGGIYLSIYLGGLLHTARRTRGAPRWAMFWVCIPSIAAGAAVSAKKGQNRTLAALEQRYAAFSQKHGFNLGGPVWRGANYAMGEMGGRSVKKLRSGKYNAYVYQTSSAAHQAYYHAVAAADRIGLLRRTFEDGSFGVE
eukprot:scaffold37889_cov66-Phaeocystis_antarctica.AAC.1